MANEKLRRFLKDGRLTISTITGVVFGVIIGLILRATREDGFTPREVMYINFIGDLFLRMLKALILPLIVSSLIAAIGSLDLNISGRIGGKAIVYYVITTVTAVLFGILLVTTIRPGEIGGDNRDNDVGKDETSQTTKNVTTVDTLMDLVRNMFPPNLVQACTSQYQTVLKPPIIFNSDLDTWLVTGKYVEGMNILGLVVASCVLGIAIGSLKNETYLLLNVIQQFNQIMMKITGWVIWLSPIGVFFLICSKLIEMDNLEELLGKLGYYFLTVTTGILFHGFIVLPLIYYVFTKKNPYRFIANMAPAIATAFGTSSSSATLPVTIQCLEERNFIDKRVSRFVLPIGATINMDGTALYEAVAAIFIAQIRGYSLSIGDIVAISITATAASIGAAGIPQAGLVTMVMVLDIVGLPAEDVSLIIAVDWLLDRIRTVVNVIGDSIGAGIVDHLSKKELQDADMNITNSQINETEKKSDTTITVDKSEISEESL